VSNKKEVLPEILAPDESAYETGYETGQDNVDFLGLDLHNPVFFISAVMILTFIAGFFSLIPPACG